MKQDKKISYTIIAAVLAVGLLFGLYALIKLKQIHQMRATIEADNAARSRLAMKSQEHADLAKYTPGRIWAAEFIETAFTLARKNGLTTLSVDQKPVENAYRQPRATGQAALQSYPVKLSFTAGYREMAEFIRELQGLDKLVTIDSLKVKREKSHLAVELTATTYAMEGNNARE